VAAAGRRHESPAELRRARWLPDLPVTVGQPGQAPVITTLPVTLRS